MLAKELEIALFEAGMFAWMAITYYWLFPSPHLKPNMAVFWYMMQIAMIAGFFTSLPANAWLIHKGWKEKMPELALEQASMRQERIGLRHRPISTQSSRVPRWMMCACILADGIHTLWKMPGESALLTGFAHNGEARHQIHSACASLTPDILVPRGGLEPPRPVKVCGF
jgi:hypothetical protein